MAQAALLCLALLPAAAGLLTLPAQAQDIELGEVTVAADRPLLMTAYTSVTVVEVRDRDPGETLADVLDEVPGVQVLRSGGEGQRQSVSIRGADSKQVAVLIEGFSLADPQGGSVDLSQIPLAAVDRIEVYRGPRGALAGASSLGGVVVIRLKTGAEAAEKVSTVGGSFGTWKGGMSAAAGGTLVTYSHEQSEGDFPYVDTNGHDRTRENNRSVTDRVLLNADLALSSRSHLELLGSAALTDRGGPGLEQFPTLEARETAHNWLAGTRFRLDRFPCRDCDLQASASYSAWQWTFADPAPYMPPPVDTQSLSQRVGLAAGTVLRASAWLSFAVQAAAAEEWMDIRRFQAGQAEHDRWSADGTLAATLTPGHLPFAADVRVRIASSGPFGAEVVPGLDVRWNAADHLAVSVSANRAYRIPTFDELYFEGSGIRGNEDLSPERSWGADASVDYRSERGGACVSVFYQIFENSILFLPASPYLVQATNTGDVTARGVEGSLSQVIGPLTLREGFSWLDSELSDTSAALPLRPAHSRFVETRLRHGPWTAAVTVRMQSRVPLDRFPGSRTEEGRVLIDAEGSVELPAGFRLSLDLRNLTDKRDAVDSFQYPLPGFAWFMSVEKEWKGGDDETDD